MSYDTYSSADVPLGTYTATLIDSRIVQAIRKGTAGVTLYWTVQENGWSRRVWKTLWLSPAALPRSKAELGRLGVSSLEDLDRDPPVKPGAVCRLVIADVRHIEGGVERSVVRWEVLAVADVASVGEEARNERW
jgi:hypothetical protein